MSEAGVVRVYRGQKEWSLEMAVSAPSLRSPIGIQQPTVWTEILLAQVQGLIAATHAGNSGARSQLETKLLNCQMKSFESPFVSCSLSWAAAQGFALWRDSPGFLLTIEGDAAAGVDFEELRRRYNLWGDSFDYLAEYGIPGRIAAPFDIIQVDKVIPNGRRPPEKIALERIYP